jgi:hypothetical protein
MHDSIAHAGTMTLWMEVRMIAVHLCRHRTCRENTYFRISNRILFLAILVIMWEDK